MKTFITLLFLFIYTIGFGQNLNNPQTINLANRNQLAGKGEQVNDTLLAKGAIIYSLLGGTGNHILGIRNDGTVIDTTVSGGGITYGGTVTSGHHNEVLYIDSVGKLGSDQGFQRLSKGNNYSTTISSSTPDNMEVSNFSVNGSSVNINAGSSSSNSGAEFDLNPAILGFTGFIQYDNSGDTSGVAVGSGLQLLNNHNTWNWPITDAAGVLTSDGNHNLSFSSGGGYSPFDTSLTQNAIIQKDTTKFVGIGTTTPQNALDISGNINLNDTLKWNGIPEFVVSRSSGNESYFLGNTQNTTYGAGSNDGNNTVFGTAAGSHLQYISSFLDASNNSLYGVQTGQAITSGTGNTAMGDAAMNQITTGNYNVAIGQFAGDASDLISDESTFLGTNAGFYGSFGLGINFHNVTYIGYNADSISHGIYQNGNTARIVSNGFDLAFANKDNSAQIGYVGVATDVQGHYTWRPSAFAGAGDSIESASDVNAKIAAISGGGASNADIHDSLVSNSQHFGSGTVTTVSSGNLSPLFTTSVATATTTPAITYSLTNVSAHKYFGNATNSTAAPIYSALVVNDLPFNIPNGNLLNSTISGVSLGSNLPTLLHGWGLKSGNYNGTIADTLVLDSTKIATPTYVATAIANAPVLVAHADSLAQTIADAIVTSYTTSTIGTYRVGGYVNITAIATNTINFKVSFTDENSNFQTLTFFPQGLTSAALATTGAFAFPTMDIRVKSGTTITLLTTATGIGSQTYNISAEIMKLY